MSTRHINVLESEKHTPKGFPSSPTFGFATKDENGNSTYQEPNTLPSCLAFVDGNAVPPTTNNGDIYILINEGNGAVNTDWNGASYNDWVRYNSGVWVSFNPFNGVTIFNKSDNLYYLYNSGWSVFVPEVPTLYNQNGTILTGREVTITDTLTFLSGRIGIGQTPNASSILDISVNNKGFLPPIVTNAEMNAISSPADYLLVFNSEEKGWFYYSPTLTDWIPLSKGYGIISVNDSSGVPTFYADLQTALETCKTSGGVFSVDIHSNIVLTSQINMNDGGTGIGNGYLFDSLTINLNGYKLSMATADSQRIISADLFGLDTKLNIINGIIERTNATSGTAIYLNKVTFNSSMLLVTSNQTAFQTGTSLPSKINLGYSKFISSGSATTMILAASTIDNFYVENTSSGIGVTCSANLNNFSVVSNSGIALDWGAGNLDNFNCYSNTSNALKIGGSGTQTASNFTLESNTNNAILRTGFGAKTVTLSNFTVKKGGFLFTGTFTKLIMKNFTITSSNQDILSGNVIRCECEQGSFIADGSFSVGITGIDCVFKHVSFASKETSCLNLGSSSSVNNSVFEHCSFTSEWDNASGHALDISSINGGTADFKLCTFNVANAGANHIYSSDAEEIKVSNCVMNDVATTSINANVTITATTDLSNGNRQL